MSIKELYIKDRPRERMISLGPSNLSSEELLSILLRTGSANNPVLELSKTLIDKIGFYRLKECTIQDLEMIRGISQSKACAIKASVEIGSRLFELNKNAAKEINSAGDVLTLLHVLRSEKKENFLAIYLNARNQLIQKETISIGTLDASLVHPREVFEPALSCLASKIIVAHNHPSGNTIPSSSDIGVTARLVEAGKIMGILIVDHIIIGKDSYYSFQENNLIGI